MTFSIPSFDTGPWAQAIGSFVDPAAIAIVVAGTAFALFLRTPLRDLANGIAALRLVTGAAWRAEDALDQIHSLSRIAARHGVVALDRSVIRDPDIAAGIAAIVDGEGPERVRKLLRERNFARADRRAAAADMWSAMADIAPAMGMIGTLIGLVRMFMVMDDPARIGGAMAIALLTTLYGAVLATMVAMPIAARIRRSGRIEAAERERIETPLVALALRERPMLREAVA